jgi:spore maturation protein CgeB
MGYNIAFFGSSLVSAYWNGAATYYRGIIKALYERGHRVTFYEPDAYDRQQNRDIDDPYWANVKIYKPLEEEIFKMIADADKADIIIKASGVGVFDELLESAVIDMKKPSQMVIFWDVDAPATLERINSNRSDPFNFLIPEYDLILTYGGGEPVIKAYKKAGAEDCIPIYNALDPSTHHPVNPDKDFMCDLAFLGNRLPDREKRVEHFFINTASEMPDKSFILAGSGWHDKQMPGNIKYVGHLFTKDHNAFNSSPLAVLNISRDSMASFGFSPATRVFEAAGSAGCIITDYWEGIDHFFEPDKEILVANTGDDVSDHIKNLDKERSISIGKAALKRVLHEHTYSHRADQLVKVLNEKLNKNFKQV